MDFIDFRSDTVTKPTPEMREAMFSAEVGDDVYGDDPEVILLEKKAAGVLGKEKALFVPSGTFGNQLCLLTHTNRGDEVIVAENCHIVAHEVGASAVIAGVQLRYFHDENGKADPEEIKKLIRGNDIHYPKTSLICMENAHSKGAAVPVENMEKVFNIAKENNISVHLDGARIFNAAFSLNVEPAEIAKFTDTVMFCLSKGLCAPIGSMVCGSEQFIEKARKNRKLMGGALRQVGVLAAPGMIALEKMVKRLPNDHDNAKFLASELEKISIFEILSNRLDINMVFFRIKDIDFSEERFVDFLHKNGLKINPPEDGEWRFVCHNGISRENIFLLAEKINEFFKKT